MQITDICLKKTKKIFVCAQPTKRLKAPKKVVLNIEPDYDFRLLGIVCTERSYRLAWFLNNKLEFSLQRVEDLELSLPRERESRFFDRFLFEDEENMLKYYLLANKDGSLLLIPEMKQADYWLLVNGVYEQLDSNGLLKEIKQIPCVQTAFWVDVPTLKSRDNLLDFEYTNDQI